MSRATRRSSTSARQSLGGSASSYFGVIANINSRLQAGTTPGNPQLVAQWGQAQSILDQMNTGVARLNSISNEVAGDSSFGNYLLNEIRAAYSLQGGIESDRDQLKQLETLTTGSLAQVDQLLNALSDEITRQSGYVAGERNNLVTLALAIQNGQLYGPSLANRQFATSAAKCCTGPARPAAARRRACAEPQRRTGRAQLRRPAAGRDPLRSGECRLRAAALYGGEPRARAQAERHLHDPGGRAQCRQRRPGRGQHQRFAAKCRECAALSHQHGIAGRSRLALGLDEPGHPEQRGPDFRPLGAMAARKPPDPGPQAAPAQPPIAKTFPVSWDELHRHARALAWRLLDLGPWQGIVAVTRGGLVPAAIVARELDIRLVDTVCIASYDDRTQGAARGAEAGRRRRRRLAHRRRSRRYRPTPRGSVREMLPKAHFATVYAKPAGRPLVDTFVTEVSQDTWILFPWDIELQFAPPIAGARPTR